MQTNKQIKLFDMFNFSVLPKFRYHTDGPDDDGSMFKRTAGSDGRIG